MDSTTFTFTDWVVDLSRRGFEVLGASHAVPIQLWMRGPGDAVLHFLARGTRLTLRRYDARDLTALILRSSCDCEEHRTAGAGVRTVLAPGAVPVAEAVFDGAAELGWRSFEAGRVEVAFAAEVLLDLLPEVGVVRPGTAVA